MSETAKVWLVEIVAWDENAQSTRTLRYATGQGHVTRTSETPPDTHYDGRVKQPLVMTRTMFAPGTTRGRSTTGFGDLVLLNGDAMLDPLIAYAFDGRAITVRHGLVGAAYPSGFVTDLIGTMGGIEVTQQEVIIKVRDRQAEVTVPLQTTKYTGDGLGTLEGVDGDLKGKPKPVLYGKVTNIAPPCVETAKLIYQVNDATIQTLDAVYDRGVALTDAGSNYANVAALLAAGPSAGQFKLYKGSEGSYFRLGSQPDGIVTADVTQGATATARTTAQIFTLLLTKAGKSSGDWSAADVTALDSAANYVLGYWTDQEAQVGDVLDQVAMSVGATWFIDSDGLFRIKQLLAPSGTTVYDFTAPDLVKPLLRITTNDPGQGIPSYQSIVRYAKNYTVQDTDLAAAVTQARRELLSWEWREAKSTDTSVQTSHLLAIQNVEDSLLTVEADAQAEATRRQGLRGVQRDMFRLVVQLNSDTQTIDLNDVIGLRHDRYGFSVVGGTNVSLFRVLGIEVDAIARELTLTVWGSPPQGVANWVDDVGDYMLTDEGAYLVFET